MCYNICSITDLKSAMFTHLLTDESEAPVFPYTFIGFSKDWVEGFVSVPEGSNGITRDSKGSNIQLGKEDANINLIKFTLSSQVLRACFNTFQ